MKTKLFVLAAGTVMLALFAFAGKQKTRLVKDKSGNYALTPEVKISKEDATMLLENTTRDAQGNLLLIHNGVCQFWIEDCQRQVVVVFSEKDNPAGLSKKQQQVLDHILSKY
jgi:hypothetical protein